MATSGLGMASPVRSACLAPRFTRDDWHLVVACGRRVKRVMWGGRTVDFRRGKGWAAGCGVNCRQGARAFSRCLITSRDGGNLKVGWTVPSSCLMHIRPCCPRPVAIHPSHTPIRAGGPSLPAPPASLMLSRKNVGVQPLLKGGFCQAHHGRLFPGPSWAPLGSGLVWHDLANLPPPHRTSTLRTGAAAISTNPFFPICGGRRASSFSSSWDWMRLRGLSSAHQQDLYMPLRRSRATAASWRGAIRLLGAMWPR